MIIHYLLAQALARNASDIHLASAQVPRIRIDGDLTMLDVPALDAKAIRQILQNLISAEQYQQWQQNQELDFVYQSDNIGRFRANASLTVAGPALAFRTIAKQPPTLKQLQLPPQLGHLCQLQHGLILVTGATGCGKSSTLAAMIHYINHSLPYHVVTVEDPVEFYHSSKRALINQRQIGHSTKSFQAALHSVLRQDPDIVLIGELRDLATVRLALTIAETGHLVLATLHTQSASQTLQRLINLFPGNERPTARTMLATSLQAVVSQRLVKRIAGGRVAACEVMIVTAAIKHMIKDERIEQIPSAMQSGSAVGMITMEQSLARLVAQGVISPEDGYHD